MYRVSAQGVGERRINVHYYYYFLVLDNFIRVFFFFGGGGGGGGSSSGKSIMPRKSERVFLCPEKGWKFFRIMTSSICERPVKETIFCSSVNPLSPRPATVLSQ